MMQSLEETFLLLSLRYGNFFGPESFYMYPVRYGKQSEIPFYQI
jgi:hypothetical protein